MSDSEEELLSAFNSLEVVEREKMDPAIMEKIVQSAVSGALAAQSVAFERKIVELNEKIDRAASASIPRVKEYSPVTIQREIKCDDTLDVIKSLSDFSGDKKLYVSWRKAATNAYEQFREFNGSVKHYQAVNIIRNKIVGTADGTLTSFATPLNFDAIIARLDATYADKRPLYLIEQELSTLRQGQLSVAEYYDKVEKTLTLLTNKCLMSYDGDVASCLNEKYRQDALRVFVSGLKKSLSDTLFASRPGDLASALALAEELEGNRERYNFAASFQKKDPEDKRADEVRVTTWLPKSNPHYVRVNPIDPNYISGRSADQIVERQSSAMRRGNYLASRDLPPPEPMDVDSGLSKYRPRNQFMDKRPRSGVVERGSDRQRQRVNMVVVEQDDNISLAECEDVNSEGEVESDSLHFLG